MNRLSHLVYSICICLTNILRCGVQKVQDIMLADVQGGAGAMQAHLSQYIFICGHGKFLQIFVDRIEGLCPQIDSWLDQGINKDIFLDSF